MEFRPKATSKFSFFDNRLRMEIEWLTFHYRRGFHFLDWGIPQHLIKAIPLQWEE